MMISGVISTILMILSDCFIVLLIYLFLGEPEKFACFL